MTHRYTTMPPSQKAKGQFPGHVPKKNKKPKVGVKGKGHSAIPRSRVFQPSSRNPLRGTEPSHPPRLQDPARPDESDDAPPELESFDSKGSPIPAFASLRRTPAPAERPSMRFYDESRISEKRFCYGGGDHFEDGLNRLSELLRMAQLWPSPFQEDVACPPGGLVSVLRDSAYASLDAGVEALSRNSSVGKQEVAACRKSWGADPLIFLAAQSLGYEPESAFHPYEYLMLPCDERTRRVFRDNYAQNFALQLAGIEKRSQTVKPFTGTRSSPPSPLEGGTAEWCRKLGDYRIDVERALKSKREEGTPYPHEASVRVFLEEVANLRVALNEGTLSRRECVDDFLARLAHDKRWNAGAFNDPEEWMSQDVIKLFKHILTLRNACEPTLGEIAGHLAESLHIPPGYPHRHTLTSCSDMWKIEATERLALLVGRFARSELPPAQGLAALRDLIDRDLMLRRCCGWLGGKDNVSVSSQLKLFCDFPNAHFDLLTAWQNTPRAVGTLDGKAQQSMQTSEGRASPSAMRERAAWLRQAHAALAAASIDLFPANQAPKKRGQLIGEAIEIMREELASLARYDGTDPREAVERFYRRVTEHEALVLKARGTGASDVPQPHVHFLGFVPNGKQFNTRLTRALFDFEIALQGYAADRPHTAFRYGTLSDEMMREMRAAIVLARAGKLPIPVPELSGGYTFERLRAVGCAVFGDKEVAAIGQDCSAAIAYLKAQYAMRDDDLILEISALDPAQIAYIFARDLPRSSSPMDTSTPHPRDTKGSDGSEQTRTKLTPANVKALDDALGKLSEDSRSSPPSARWEKLKTWIESAKQTGATDEASLLELAILARCGERLVQEAAKDLLGKLQPEPSPSSQTSTQTTSQTTTQTESPTMAGWTFRPATTTTTSTSPGSTSQTEGSPSSIVTTSTTSTTTTTSPTPVVPQRLSPLDLFRGARAMARDALKLLPTVQPHAHGAKEIDAFRKALATMERDGLAEESLAALVGTAKALDKLEGVAQSLAAIKPLLE